MLNSLAWRNRQQPVNNFYSSWAEILFGDPHGSVWGPTYFNIFIYDLFLFIKNKDVASYIDDIIPYKTGDNSTYVIHNLKVIEKPLLSWFEDNRMKLNQVNITFCRLEMALVKPQSKIKQLLAVNMKYFEELK